MNPTMATHYQMSGYDKAATLLAWTLGGGLFLTVGWIAMAPVDPLAAVSLYTNANGLFMWVQAVALACVAAAVASAVAGRRLPDLGVFVAALGPALVSLRGGTSTYFLLLQVEDSAALERAMAGRFALEALAWFVVMVAALIVSAGVRRWLDAALGGGSESAARHVDKVYREAFQDVPASVPLLGRFRLPGASSFREGLTHTLFVTLAGLLLIGFLSSGHLTREVTHGQAVFAVAAGLAIASYFAHRLTPAESALWGILAVPLIALLGMGWAFIRAGSTAVPNLPSSGFLCILPIQYVGVGVLAVVIINWYMNDPVHREHREHRSAGPGSPGKAGG